MGIVRKCLKDLKKERVTTNNAEKNRYIPQETYMKMKAKKTCDHCGEPFGNKLPRIHHKIPVKNGGNNQESNLMAVHLKCHRILDGEN